MLAIDIIDRSGISPATEEQHNAVFAIYFTVIGVTSCEALQFPSGHAMWQQKILHLGTRV